MAQDTTQENVEPAALQAQADEANPPVAVPQADTPYEAYEQGLFDQALQGFTDLQVEFPEDPEVALNVGSAHYQMRNYAEADRAFSTAALATDPSLRAEALYNMGNSAFRQGRLEDSVGIYKAALEINPDDEDAKFNLEFVRNEIRRRHEEAQKRQEQQQQGQDQQQDQQQQDPQQQDEQQPNEQQSGQDSDQDGLPDEVEQSGENPTDPQNPDSDGDSLADGAEDINRNGRLDPGETDPNKADSDGDGVPDAQEVPATGQGAQAEGQEQAELTPEEADRYLQALEEGRPVREQPQGGRRSRTDKDW
jgi:Ca-activated chloride channel family protein